MPNVRRAKDYVDEWRRLWEPDLEAIAYNGATCDPTRVDPKVLQWVRQHCADKPHFIKVINETAAHGWHPPAGAARDQGHQQCKLFVPRPFVREHFKELGRVATLEDGETHKKWKVSFGVTPKKTISWLQGWKRVATDNNLTPDDVMIFVLVGHSHFLFHLFNEHGHPKVQHSNATKSVKPEILPTHSHLAHDHTDTEHCPSVKKRRLVDLSDVDFEIALIVKTEPVVDQPHGDNATSELEAPLWSDDERDPNCEKLSTPEYISTAGRVIGNITGRNIGSTFPDSELTVTDLGEETISRGDELGQRRSTDQPQIARRNIITDTRITEKKSTSTSARCNATPFQSGDDEGPVMKLRKVEVIETTNLMKDEMGGNNMVSLPPVHALPFDPLSFDITSRRRTPTPIERKRAKEVAKAHADLLRGHRFVVVLTEAQVYRDFHVTLPKQFVSDSRLPTSLTRLKLVDSTGKAWEMYTRMNSSGAVAFHRKFWGLFSLEHFLEEGDVCLLQLKSKDALTISVRIFRVVQLPKLVDRNNASIHDHYDMRVKS